MSHVEDYLEEAQAIIAQLSRDDIEKMVQVLLETREKGGRVFILGVGGSASNASHTVNDFRKLTGIETYAPTDNVAELTARTNDEGWHTVYSEWLKTSNIRKEDVVFILSVGGGNREKNISRNLVEAMDVAKEKGARIIGVVGRDGGYAKKVGDAVVMIPVVNPEHVTPHSEAFQGVICHLVASDPRLMVVGNKWESTCQK